MAFRGNSQFMYQTAIVSCDTDVKTSTMLGRKFHDGPYRYRRDFGFAVRHPCRYCTPTTNNDDPAFAEPD